MNKLLFGPLSLSFITATAQCAKPDLADDSPKPVVEAKPPAPAATSARPKDDIGALAVRVPIDGLPAFGSPRALVTIVAFTDYECRYCATADARIAQLRAEYGDRIRLVVASYPLRMHEYAAPAARAFLAAVEQGKGEAMHLRLFANEGKIAHDEGLREAAAHLGLDVSAFDRARLGSSTETALRRAEALGAALAVNGTPTLFVNGRRLVGAGTIEAFRSLIDEELAKAQALVGKGIPPEDVYATIVSQAPEVSPPRTEAVSAP